MGGRKGAPARAADLRAQLGHRDPAGRRPIHLRRAAKRADLNVGLGQALHLAAITKTIDWLVLEVNVDRIVSALLRGHPPLGASTRSRASI